MPRWTLFGTTLISLALQTYTASAQPRDLAIPDGTAWEQAEFQGRAQAFVRTDSYSFVISCLNGRDDLAVWLPHDFFNRSRTSSVATLEIHSDGRFLQNAPLRRDNNLIAVELHSATVEGLKTGRTATIRFPVQFASSKRTVTLQFPTVGSSGAIERAQCAGKEAPTPLMASITNTFDFVAFQVASREMCNEVRLDIAFHRRILQVTNPPKQFLREMTRAHTSPLIYARIDEFKKWIAGEGCKSASYESAVSSALDHFSRY